MESQQFTEKNTLYTSDEFIAVGKVSSIIEKCQFQG